jgi:hypothetical protein
MRSHRTSRTWRRAARDAVVACTLSLLAPTLSAPASAQEGAEAAPEDTTAAAPGGDACQGPEHREFDFWEGEWTVRSPDGERLGRNRIRVVAGGCALREVWRGAGGSVGTSLNFRSGDSGRWHQVWVGGDGGILRLEGGLRDSRMVLEGDRPGRDVRDRISWTPRDDGTVRQLWEISRDGGESWETVFDGIYERREDPGDGGAAGNAPDDADPGRDAPDGGIFQGGPHPDAPRAPEHGVNAAAPAAPLPGGPSR